MKTFTIDRNTWFFEKKVSGEPESLAYEVHSPLEHVKVVNGEAISTFPAELTKEIRMSKKTSPKKYFPATTSEVINQLLPLIDGKTIFIDNPYTFAYEHKVFIPWDTFTLPRSVLSPTNVPRNITLAALPKIGFSRENYGGLFGGIIISNSYNMRRKLSILSGIIRIMCTNMALLRVEYGDEYSMKHLIGGERILPHIVNASQEAVTAVIESYRRAEKYADMPKWDLQQYGELLEAEDSDRFARFMDRAFDHSETVLDLINVFSFFSSHSTQQSVRSRAEKFFSILPEFSNN